MSQNLKNRRPRILPAWYSLYWSIGDIETVACELAYSRQTLLVKLETAGVPFLASGWNTCCFSASYLPFAWCLHQFFQFFLLFLGIWFPPAILVIGVVLGGVDIGVEALFPTRKDSILSHRYITNSRQRTLVRRFGAGILSFLSK